MPKCLLIACATLIIATQVLAEGILDRWTEAGLTKAFFMTYLVKVIHEGPLIKKIILSREGHKSGNAWFHGGECYALVMQIARGPEKPINFDTDISVEDKSSNSPPWIDKVTGTKVLGNEEVQNWRFEAIDSSGTPILTAYLADGSHFVITEVNRP
jgi:hypothetical protein